MPTAGRKPTWQAIGQSVQGAAHIRANLPNQDAWRCLPPSGEGPPLILAVADGHGSAKSFRSDTGSALAVDAALGTLEEIFALRNEPRKLSLSAIKRMAEDQLPREIVRRWILEVERHRKAHPFTGEELSALERRSDPGARQKVEAQPLLAYGATLLTALVAEDFILYLQLGDGDILTVSNAGEVARPLPEDTRLFANQTTSLCMTDAWRDFRMRFQALAGPPPALILLSTDGYANSFINEEAFLKVGADIWDIIRSEGLEFVQASLADWLNEASTSGSGDDTTLGLMCRTDLLPSPQERAMLEQVANAAAKEAHADAETVSRLKLWVDGDVKVSTEAVSLQDEPPPETDGFSDAESGG